MLLRQLSEDALRKKHGCSGGNSPRNSPRKPTEEASTYIFHSEAWMLLRQLPENP